MNRTCCDECLSGRNGRCFIRMNGKFMEMVNESKEEDACVSVALSYRRGGGVGHISNGDGFEMRAETAAEGPFLRANGSMYCRSGPS